MEGGEERKKEKKKEKKKKGKEKSGGTAPKGPRSLVRPTLVFSEFFCFG
jgi:hypothetical protein